MDDILGVIERFNQKLANKELFWEDYDYMDELEIFSMDIRNSGSDSFCGAYEILGHCYANRNDEIIYYRPYFRNRAIFYIKLSTIDEAKAFCQEHYDNLKLSLQVNNSEDKISLLSNESVTEFYISYDRITNSYEVNVVDNHGGVFNICRKCKDRLTVEEALELLMETYFDSDDLEGNQ